MKALVDTHVKSNSQVPKETHCTEKLFLHIEAIEDYYSYIHYKHEFIISSHISMLLPPLYSPFAKAWHQGLPFLACCKR